MRLRPDGLPVVPLEGPWLDRPPWPALWSPWDDVEAGHPDLLALCRLVVHGGPVGALTALGDVAWAGGERGLALASWRAARAFARWRGVVCPRARSGGGDAFPG